MKDWRDTLVGPQTSVKDALQVINRNAAQIALVVDSEGKLLGTVTDGDVRRSILRGLGLDAEVVKVMFANPKTSLASRPAEEILEKMKRLQIRQMPILDAERRVIGLEILDDLLNPSVLENWVVLMAGGLGRRMSPLTDSCPKPMLKVGGKPVLETILQQFQLSGFKKFFVSVNFMAEVIEEYFGDGSKWGVEIHYLREKSRLGTAGALSLLPEQPKLPILVMNGDLLTKANMRQILEFHEAQKASVTMGVREYDFQVPYGVVKMEKEKVVSIDEKPIHRFFVNAGIYVLDPGLLDLIPRSQPVDMTQMMDKLMENKGKVAAYPIQEYWLDIGRLADFERAKGDFFTEFGQ